MMSTTSTTATIKLGVDKGNIKNGEADMTTMEATGAPEVTLTEKTSPNRRLMAATSQSGWHGKALSHAT